MLVFAALALPALGFVSNELTIPLMMHGDSCNYTNAAWPDLFNLSPVSPGAKSARNGARKSFNTFFCFCVLSTLSLLVFGLDVRRYAPLLVTEVIVNSVALAGVSSRYYYLCQYPGSRLEFQTIIDLSFAFSLYRLGNAFVSAAVL